MLELTQELLIEALDYDELEGTFTWKVNRPLSHFKNLHAYNTYQGKFAGKVAGHKYYDRKADIYYVQIRLFTKLYLAHRLAWFYVNGVWPEQLVDHIDGEGLNNSLHNLRLADREINGKNCSLSKNNKSGVNGVYWNKVNSRWVAEGHYTEAGLHKKINLGSYVDLEDAKKARESWEDTRGGFTKRHGK